MSFIVIIITLVSWEIPAPDSGIYWLRYVNSQIVYTSTWCLTDCDSNLKLSSCLMVNVMVRILYSE